MQQPDISPFGSIVLEADSRLEGLAAGIHELDKIFDASVAFPKKQFFEL